MPAATPVITPDVPIVATLVLALLHAPTVDESDKVVVAPEHTGETGVGVIATLVLIWKGAEGLPLATTVTE